MNGPLNDTFYYVVMSLRHPYGGNLGVLRQYGSSSLEFKNTFIIMLFFYLKNTHFFISAFYFDVRLDHLEL